jgi:hypothetical protein
MPSGNPDFFRKKTKIGTFCFSFEDNGWSTIFSAWKFLNESLNLKSQFSEHAKKTFKHSRVENRKQMLWFENVSSARKGNSCLLPVFFFRFHDACLSLDSEIAYLRMHYASRIASKCMVLAILLFN